MITSNAPASSPDATAAAYEQLRRHVLAGSAAPGDHFGLLLLLREGIAVWIDRRSTCAVANSVADRERPAAAPFASDDLTARIVLVLASMAMSDRQEMRR